MKCVCGADVDTAWTQDCGKCGRFFHGLEDSGQGKKRPIWGVRPPRHMRPRGRDLIAAGYWMGAIGIALYAIALFFVPAVLQEPLSITDEIYRRAPSYTPNLWRPALMALGIASFGLAPIVWATGQIVAALFWLRQEPEPSVPILVTSAEARPVTETSHSPLIVESDADLAASDSPDGERAGDPKQVPPPPPENNKWVYLGIASAVGLLFLLALVLAAMNPTRVAEPANPAASFNISNSSSDVVVTENVAAPIPVARDDVMRGDGADTSRADDLEQEIFSASDDDEEIGDRANWQGE